MLGAFAFERVLAQLNGASVTVGLRPRTTCRPRAAVSMATSFGLERTVRLAHCARAERPVADCEARLRAKTARTRTARPSPPRRDESHTRPKASTTPCAIAVAYPRTARARPRTSASGWKCATIPTGEHRASRAARGSTWPRVALPMRARSSVACPSVGARKKTHARHT